MFTVPIDKQMRIRKVHISIGRASGAAGSAEVNLKVREFGKTWIVKRPFTVTTSYPINKSVAGLIIPPRANVVMTLQTVSDTDTNCDASWEYELIDL